MMAKLTVLLESLIPYSVMKVFLKAEFHSGTMVQVFVIMTTH